MCIHCVMCGACMGLQEGDPAQYEHVCPECGVQVAESDISCPACHTFLPHNARARAIAAAGDAVDAFNR